MKPRRCVRLSTALGRSPTHSRKVLNMQIGQNRRSARRCALASVSAVAFLSACAVSAPSTGADTEPVHESTVVSKGQADVPSIEQNSTASSNPGTTTATSVDNAGAAPGQGTPVLGIAGASAPSGNAVNSDSMPSDPCAPLAQRWREVTKANCASCHGSNSPARANFSYVLDASALVASGKVVPGAPERSPLFAKVSSGAMPPPAQMIRPSAADIETLRAWIACGAPPPQVVPCETGCTTFFDIDARLSLMLRDLQSLASDEERADTRYIDLSSSGNAGHGDALLDVQRGALSYIVNALSSGPNLVVPKIIDAQGLLFRIRLGDYGWNAALWEKIVASYPYAVSYDPSSRTLPHDELSAQSLRDRTGTEVPYVQADWFFAHVSRPPLYHDLLGLPDTLADLQATLSVDVKADIAANRVARSGFNDSGLSHFNRVIERHPSAANGATFWLTYDFSAGTDTSNILVHPLDFVWGSSELLFSLPNGLYAFMVIDAQGRRLDKAPNSAVLDPSSGDLALENGLSCINCHADAGILSRTDRVRAASLQAQADPVLLDKVLAIYPEKAQFDALVASDQTRYRKSLAAVAGRGFANGKAHLLNDAYLGLMSLADVAGVLGIESSKLQAAIDATPQVFPAELRVLRSAKQPSLSRQAFDALFADLVRVLGLGRARAGG